MISDEVGIVVIGRNEGERLRACLESLRGRRLVYVDSASTDGSPELARSFGAEVVDLDMSRPFSAARARNEGYSRLAETPERAAYIQFVDGDCVVVEGWLETARDFLRENHEYAAVSGRLRERFPERSIYNRLCDIEWDSPVGDVSACGGIAMYRTEAFEGVGRFDPTVVAGEEPELCLRLRRKGWKIRKLPCEMALHDASMTRFGQWWRRAMRGGYGGTDVSLRFEHGKGLNSDMVRSARIWGIGWPLLVLASGFAAGITGGPGPASAAAAAAFALLPLQMARVGFKAFRRRSELKASAEYGVLIMLGKWAHLQGQSRYAKDVRNGKHPSLIEYK